MLKSEPDTTTINKIKRSDTTKITRKLFDWDLDDEEEDQLLTRALDNEKM
jgi:hypothetical protein